MEELWKSYGRVVKELWKSYGRVMDVPRCPVVVEDPSTLLVVSVAVSDWPSWYFASVIILK